MNEDKNCNESKNHSVSYDINNFEKKLLRILFRITISYLSDLFLRKGPQAKNPGPEEMTSLNKTISRLFNHLEINKMASDSKVTSTKPRHLRRSPSPHRRHRREDHDVRELLEKLQTFEDELQRRKEKQNEEILR